MKIHWYPGHMEKSKKILKENLQLVNTVVEILDARIPFSSRNSEFDSILKNKNKIVVLNKEDLADPYCTKKWLNHYHKLGMPAAAVNSLTGKGIARVYNLMKEYSSKKKKYIPMRVMVIGIPNVGKSAFINKLIGRSSAKTGDRPGITKGKQWIRLKNGIEILDTPGIFWPELTDEESGVKLAAVNVVDESAYDKVELSYELLKFLIKYHRKELDLKYDVNSLDMEPDQILESIGVRRGCLRKGEKVDLTAAADIFLKEFREGKIARITLDRLHNYEN